MPSFVSKRALPMALAAVGWLTVAAAGDFAAIDVAQPDAGTSLPLLDAGRPLPASLPFALTLSYDCPAGTTAQELFVSVADTSRFVDATALPSPQSIAVDVPMAQLQWLARPAANCASIDEKRRADGIAPDGGWLFRLHASAAAYATLRCRAQDGGATSAVTASTPLDIWLSCPPPGPPGPASSAPATGQLAPPSAADPGAGR